jgi:hypothetical protein
MGGETGRVDGSRRYAGENRNFQLRYTLREGRQDSHLIAGPRPSSREHQRQIGKARLRSVLLHGHPKVTAIPTVRQ